MKVEPDGGSVENKGGKESLCLARGLSHFFFPSSVTIHLTFHPDYLKYSHTGQVCQSGDVKKHHESRCETRLRGHIGIVQMIHHLRGFTPLTDIQLATDWNKKRVSRKTFTEVHS